MPPMKARTQSSSSTVSFAFPIRASKDFRGAVFGWSRIGINVKGGEEANVMLIGARAK